MEFGLTEEHHMIQEMTADFVEKEVAPVASEIDEKDEFPWEVYKKMADLGLLSMTLPSVYEGAEADTISWSLVIEELAKGSPAVADSLMLNKLMCDALLRNGTEEQKRKYIEPLSAGEIICATVITEPEAGSDVAALKTTARLDGNHYVLNGTKHFITCGGIANMAIVLAYTDKSKRHKGLSQFIVEEGAEGFKKGRKEILMGVRGLETSELIFEDCRIPRENLLGVEGEGFKQAMISLDTGRVGIASLSLGIAQAALEEALQYAEERVQFGQPIAEFQAIQFMLADMSTAIEAARLLIYKAAYLKDQGIRFTKEAAQAKLFASDLAVEATTKSLQIHGGYGYTKDYPIERLYRDARINQIWEGTNEIQRLIIARSLLKSFRAKKA